MVISKLIPSFPQIEADLRTLPLGRDVDQVAMERSEVDALYNVRPVM